MILGEFADTTRAEFVFKHRYKTLNVAWKTTWGWPLFLQPGADDEHLLDALHVPVTAEQREFDEQVLNLAKLLIDFLNEKALAANLKDLPLDTKGIEKLRRFLGCNGVTGTDEISFLKGLQALRSAGAAHRKGENYKRALGALALAGKSGAAAFHALLDRALALLQMLEHAGRAP